MTLGQRNGAGNVPRGNRAPSEVKNPVEVVAEREVPKAPAQSASVEMPPELCLVLGFSAAVIRSAYWVPSVMHRIKTAVLACQLRRSIRAPRIPVMEVVFLSCFSLFAWIAVYLCIYSECLFDYVM